MNPPRASDRVKGKRVAMPDATLWFWNSDRPRFPRTAWLIQQPVLDEEWAVQVELMADATRSGPAGRAPRRRGSGRGLRESAAPAQTRRS